MNNFAAAEPGPHYFMDSTVYALHDEWYWMRLLNGFPIAGYDVEPVAGETFATIDDVYDWMPRFSRRGGASPRSPTNGWLGR